MNETFDKGKKSNWKWFILSLLIYTFSSIGHNYIFPLNHAFQLMQAIAAVLLFITYIKLPKYFRVGGFAGKMYMLLCLFCIITVVRGFFTPLPVNAKFLLLRETFLLPYFLPFLLLCKIEVKDFSVLFKYLKIFILFGIFYSIMNAADFYVDANYLFTTMDGFDGYIIGRTVVALVNLQPLCFFCFYFSKWNRFVRFLFILAFILSFLSAMMMGRRSNCLEPIGLLFLEMLYMKFYKTSNMKRFIFVLTLIGCFIVVSRSMESTKVIESFSDSFEVLAGRIGQNNRIGTETDLYNDFNIVDWIFGRGINGTYKSPEVMMIDSLHRSIIETGYLNIILHGGLLLLVPYILLLLNSIYKGLKYSKNEFARYCSLFILYKLLWLVPGGVLSLNFDHVLLWFCIYVCQSYYIRHLSDEQVKIELKFDKVW